MEFHAPPVNQGQIVNVSYALVGDTVIQHVYDQSDQSEEYYASKALVGDEGDYWNRPPRNKRWRKVSPNELGRLLAASR